MGALIHVTAWERKSTGRRILIAFARVALLIVVLVVLIHVLGPPISIFVTTRWMARKVPGVRIAPRPLTDYSVSAGPTTALSYFGYQFEVPWNAVFKANGGKANTGGKVNIVGLLFESGQGLIFWVPKNENGLFTEMVQDRSMNMANLEPLLGDLTRRSAYDQYAVLVGTTPQTIRAFGPRAEAIRGSTLLLMKAIALGPGLPTGVFSFQFSDKRGFQIGDPQKSKRIDLEVFDMKGHNAEILLFAKDSAKFSQPEINRILMSLHPVSLETPVTATANLASLPNR